MAANPLELHDRGEHNGIFPDRGFVGPTTNSRVDVACVLLGDAVVEDPLGIRERQGDSLVPWLWKLEDLFGSA